MEILTFGDRCEVWDSMGNKVFEAEFLQECEDWISENCDIIQVDDVIFGG